jgi:hypothetical protein
VRWIGDGERHSSSHDLRENLRVRRLNDSFPWTDRDRP